MTIRIALISLFLCVSLQGSPAGAADDRCPPTQPDAQGPFYKPSVPLRDNTGTGLIIEGAVLTTDSCEAIAGARVEWWQTAETGRYDDDHRGARLTDSEGQYRIETDFPPPYSGRPSHVHFKVFAPGHRTLTTQVYPEKGQRVLPFDFVLVPE
jgi:protocatechuate 3,4-dioxygenase beta subunit